MSKTFKNLSLERLMNVAKAVNIYFEIHRLVESKTDENLEPLMVSFKDLFGIDFNNVNPQMMDKSKQEIFDYLIKLTKDMVEDSEDFEPLIPWDLREDLYRLLNNFSIIAESKEFAKLYSADTFYLSTKKCCENLHQSLIDYPDRGFYNDIISGADLINSFSQYSYRYINAAQEASKNNDNRDGLINNLNVVFMCVVTIDCILLARNMVGEYRKEFKDRSTEGNELNDSPCLEYVGTVMPQGYDSQANELNSVYYTPEETIHVEFENMEKILDGAEALLLGKLNKEKHKFFFDYCIIPEISGNESFVDTIKGVATKAYEGISTFFKTLKDFIVGVKKDAGKTLSDTQGEINTALANINNAKELTVTEKMTSSIANKLSSVDKDDLANMFRNAKSKSDIVNAFKALLKDMADSQKEIAAMESDVNSASSSPQEILALTNKAKDDMDKDAQSVFREEVKSTIETIKSKGRELSDKARNVTRSISAYITASQLAKKISTQAK